MTDVSTCIKLKNVETQTRLHDTKMCAFIHSSMDYTVYHINCFYCEKTFPLWDWSNFVLHNHDEHSYDENIPLDVGECQKMDVLVNNHSVYVLCKDDKENNAPKIINEKTPSISVFNVENENRFVQMESCVNQVNIKTEPELDITDEESNLDDESILHKKLIHNIKNPETEKRLFNETLTSTSKSPINQTRKHTLLKNFKIPWHKLPQNILRSCYKKQKLGRQLSVFTNIVIDELRCISKHIPVSVYYSIAKQATKKYPKTFSEQDSEGRVFSYKNFDLVSKFQNRNKFLNKKMRKHLKPLQYKKRLEIMKNTVVAENAVPESLKIESIGNYEISMSENLCNDLDLSCELPSTSYFARNCFYDTIKTATNDIDEDYDEFQGFKIPWHKFSPKILNCLNKKQSLGPHFSTFTNHLVDELRSISTRISTGVFRLMAEEAINKYPETFNEHKFFLMKKLRNRNNFLNASARRKKINAPHIAEKCSSTNFSEFESTSSKENTIKTSAHISCIDVDNVNSDESSTYFEQATSTLASQNESLLFYKFKIPWHRLPSAILDCLHKKRKLERHLAVFTKFIIDELRLISKYIPMSAYRSIAAQAIEKYPDTFLEHDNEGNVISATNLTLISKLRNRNSFLNRAPKGSKNNSKNSNISTQFKYYRKVSTFKKTCTNWQPTDLNKNAAEEINEMSIKKNRLLELHKQHNYNSQNEIILTFMKETFPLQRISINNSITSDTSIRDIMSEWPFLFKEDCINQHFDELMSIDGNCFEANFLLSKNKIISYLKSLKSLNRIRDYTENEQIMRGIAAYFGEDLNLLYKIYEYGTTLEDILQVLQIKTPFIAIIKKSSTTFFDIYVFVDQIVVMTMENTEFDFLKLIALIVKLFYVLNIFYPRDISQTLEFCVKFFFKYYCEFTRGSKRNINNIQKVNSLIRQLSKQKPDSNDTKEGENSETDEDKSRTKRLKLTENIDKANDLGDTISEYTITSTPINENRKDIVKTPAQSSSESRIFSEISPKFIEKDSFYESSTINVTESFGEVNNVNNVSLLKNSSPTVFDLKKQNSNATFLKELAFDENSNNSERSTFNAESEYPTTNSIHLSSVTVNCNNEELLMNFKIPWHKLPASIINICYKKKPLGSHINSFTNFLIDELREISTFIPLKVFRSIAKQATDKYPDTFLEHDSEGHVISYKNLSLITKLRNRNNTVRRTIERNANDLDYVHPIKYIRRIDTLRRTCSNWHPTYNKNISTEEINQMKIKRDCLLNLQKQNKFDKHKEMILVFMKETFPLQRSFINKLISFDSSIKEIMAEWPFLFYEECLNQHFNELLSIDGNCFEEQFRFSKSKMISFFKSLKTQNPKSCDYIDDEQIFSAIALEFGEDMSLLYKKFECGTCVADITKELTITTPFIAMIESDTSVFDIYVYIEKICVMTFKNTQPNFVHLISLIIKLFYTFNFLYPKDISQTLEFCVKIGYKYYCDVPRGLKGNIHRVQKVNSIIKRISNMRMTDEQTSESRLHENNEDTNLETLRKNLGNNDSDGFNDTVFSHSIFNFAQDNENCEQSKETPISEETYENHLKNTNEPFQETPSDGEDVTTMFKNFQIPWHNFSPQILDCLKKKKKLGQYLSTFTNHLINDLRSISTHIPTRVYHSIVVQATKKFPYTFQEYDKDGQAIPYSKFHLIRKLRNRNNFLNYKGNDDSELASTALNYKPSNSVDSFNIEENASTFLEQASSVNNKNLLFYNFKIPWNKLPSQLLNCLNKKQKLGRHYTAFIGFLVDELRLISKNIPVNVFHAIAKQATEKYPHTFLEHDNEGRIISLQNLSLVVKLRNRNNFLNRTPRSFEDKIRDLSIKSNKHTKLVEILRKTCTNWQPMEQRVESSETINDMESKKNCLLELHKESNYAIQKQKILKLMKDTFPLQRIFINDSVSSDTSITEIMAQWPFLFTDDCLNQHFEELMLIDANSFEENFYNFKDKTILFLKTLKQQSQKFDFTDDEQIFKEIAAYFNEDLSMLYKKYDYHINFQMITDNLPTTTPFIAIVKNSNAQTSDIYIFINKVLVMTINDTYENFVYLISLLIKLFYVLNILYPKNISQTMEFYVKFYYKYYCDVTRGSKRTMFNIQKVNSLIKRISDMKPDIEPE